MMKAERVGRDALNWFSEFFDTFHRIRLKAYHRRRARRLDGDTLNNILK